MLRITRVARATTATTTATTKKIPVAHLRPPQTGIPSDMAAELSGTCDLAWLSDLPKYSTMLAEACKPLPQSDAFWQSPTHEALETVARCSSYYEVLRVISEHGYFSLLPNAALKSDAPLPHVVYEDLMQALMTCSMQRPPEEQFQLPPGVLRLLLCTAAHHLVHDAGYFGTVEKWFRAMERQQSLGAEAWSAWVMCCVAANRVDQAMLFLQHMELQRIPFDGVVFNFMLHPSEQLRSATGAPHQLSSKKVAKGFLQQQRVLANMLVDDGTVAAGVHAMFVFYAITRRPVHQWETIRVAAAEMLKQRQRHGHSVTPTMISRRTLKMIKSVFKHEKGQRCGPLTIRTLVHIFALEKDMFHTCLALSVLRQREMDESLVPARFSVQEQERVMRCFDDESDARDDVGEEELAFAPARKRDGDDVFTKHLPLLKRLLQGDRSLTPLDDPSASASASASASPRGETTMAMAMAMTMPTSSTAVEIGDAPDDRALHSKSYAAAECSEVQPLPHFTESEVKGRIAEVADAAFDEGDAMRAVASFIQEQRQKEAEEKKLMEKRATAWIDPAMRDH